MGYGHQTIAATIATAATSSDAIDITSWDFVAFEIPTFAVGVITATANVYAQVCDTASGTFRRVQDLGVYSGGSGILDWEVPSTTGNRTVICRPASRFNFVKIELSNTATAQVSCVVHVSK